MRWLGWGVAVMVLLGGLPIRLGAAHEKFKIVGSVVAITKDELAVKAIDGATYEMDFLDGAPITDKRHKKVGRATLKVGERVVVLAVGHDMFDLEVSHVQLMDR